MLDVSIPEINIIISIATSIMALFIAFHAWYRRHAQGAYWFSGLVLAGSWVTFWYALEAAAGYDVNTYVYFSKWEYIGLTLIPLFWLGFAITHGGKEQPFSKSMLALLILIPVVTIVLAWTNEWHGLIWKSPAFERGIRGPIFEPVYGTWFWIYTVYAYVIFLIGSIALIRQAFGMWRVYRVRAILILVGTAMPWLSNVLDTFDNLNPVPALYLNSIFLGAAILTFAFALFQLGLLDVMPLAHETILNSVPDGIIVTDLHNRIITLNQNATHYLEQVGFEPVGRPLSSVAPSLATYINGIDRLDNASEFWQYADRIIQVDVSPVKDRTGQQRGNLLVLQDVTEQQAAEAAVRRSEAHFRALIEHGQDVIALIDREGIVRYKSPSIQHVLGYEPHELVGHNAWELVHPDEIESARGLFEILLSYPDTQLRVEMQHQHKDGGYRWLEATATNALDDEAVQALIVNYRDVTERRVIEQEVQQQRDFYQTIMDSLGQGITVIGDEGTFEYVNPAYAKLVGYAVEDLIGKTPFDLTVTEDHSALSTAGIHRRERKSTTYETRLRGADGTSVPVLITGVPRYRNDEVMGTIAVITDLTLQKQTEAVIRQQKQVTDALIDSVPGVFFLFDEAGKMLRWNQNLLTLSGYAAEEVSVRSPLDFIYEPDKDSAARAIQSVIQQGQTTLEARMVYRDGTVIPFYFSAKRVEVGGTMCIVGVGIDISERKQAEQQALTLALERHRIELLQGFIQDASHEFRTPLSIIQSSLYLIQATQDPETRQQKLTQIEKQVQRIAHLIDMLVKMSQLDSGITMNMQLVNLNHVLREAIDEMQTDFLTKNIRLQFETDQTLPRVTGNADLLMDAIQQIIDNAIRHSPPGGMVTIHTHTEGDHAVITIQDSGPGIPPAVLPRIFERFFRHDYAHSTPGFGLGLPIAQRIIHEHGGKIEVNGQLEHGTVVVISLPL